MKLNLKSRTFRRRMLALILTVLTLGALCWIALENTAEQQARMSETQLVFAKPAEWLAAPKDHSEFLKAVEANEVAEVGFSPQAVLYTTRGGKKFSTRALCSSVNGCEGLANLSALSLKHGFKLASLKVETRTPIELLTKVLLFLGSAAVNVLVVVLCVMFIKQVRRGNESLSLAKRPETRFSDVIGAEEAKAALSRVKTFLRDPDAYVSVGAKAPRGVLLEGPPGTGKTLLARALAGECGANFISVDGSYFTSMFYGMGVFKAKSLFALAREHAPCILFIDEMDAIGRRMTGANMGGGEQEGNRIINRILVEMDGFSNRSGVIVIGATNHAANIDPAMRRPGRFDLVVGVSLPTPPERTKLFDYYLEKVKADRQIDTASLARVAAGLSPADIANLVNKAASTAAEEGAHSVSEGHVYRALETHQLGGDVSSVKNILTPGTRRRIAIHEASHAVIGHLTGVGGVERISIEPRGQALGVTFISRRSEEPLYSESELHGRVAMTLAGREGELLLLGNVSSGASDDLEKATSLATSMVGNFGFSKEFGLLNVKGIPKELLGPDIQRSVLLEARRVLEAAQRLCVLHLTLNQAVLVELTELLLEHETLSGDALRSVLAKLQMGRPTFVSDHNQPARALAKVQSDELPSTID